jgi:hypothetical protein
MMRKSGSWFSDLAMVEGLTAPAVKPSKVLDKLKVPDKE